MLLTLKLIPKTPMLISDIRKEVSERSTRHNPQVVASVIALLQRRKEQLKNRHQMECHIAEKIKRLERQQAILQEKLYRHWDFYGLSDKDDADSISWEWSTHLFHICNKLEILNRRLGYDGSQKLCPRNATG